MQKTSLENHAIGRICSFYVLCTLLIDEKTTFFFSDSVHTCPLLWRLYVESYKNLSTVANARTDVECCYQSKKPREEDDRSIITVSGMCENDSYIY